MARSSNPDQHNRPRHGEGEREADRAPRALARYQPVEGEAAGGRRLALFFISDAVLAVDRFRTPFAAARAVVLSTYWIGQSLIAISTRWMTL